MTLGLHNLQPSKGAKKLRKCFGRGNGSGLGTTAGRGTKGQKARSGVSGLKRKGLKMNLTQLPKFRGTKSVKEPVQILNLTVIEKYFKDGQEVSMKTLKEKNIISSINRKVKILGVGALSKKLHFKNFAFSGPAREQIEKVGGTIEGNN